MDPGEHDKILLGGWLYALALLCFIWFVVALRGYLLEADAAPGTLSTTALAGPGLAAAIFGMLQPGGDMALAINKNDVSPATAGAFTTRATCSSSAPSWPRSCCSPAVGIMAFRTAILPRWWGVLSLWSRARS